MAALQTDDGTHSFLAFLSAAQEDDTMTDVKTEPAAAKQLNADANLLAQLTNDTHKMVVPQKSNVNPLAGIGSAAAKPMRRSPKTPQSWQPDQDEVLRKAVAENGGRNWKQIASSVPGKSPTQCLHRWQRVLNPNVVKGPWKHVEDERLKELVDKIGSKHWSRIAQEMLGRNGKQCRERWINHLKPDILKDPWTREEEEVLLRAYAEIGSKWAEMEKILPGRTENAIKNHWHSTLRKSRTIEDYAQNEHTRMVKRKRPAVVEPHAQKTEPPATTSTELRIDTDNLAAAADAATRTDSTSPVFSPARAHSPDNGQGDKGALIAAADTRTAVKKEAADLVTPTSEAASVAQKALQPDATATPSSYAAGDILAVRDAETSFLLCRVVESGEKSAEGGLRVAWYDCESAGDFTAGKEEVSSGGTRPKGRDSPLIAGETLGLYGSTVEVAETIRPDTVLLKLKAGVTDARLTITADDCMKLDQIAATTVASGGADQGAKRARSE